MIRLRSELTNGIRLALGSEPRIRRLTDFHGEGLGWSDRSRPGYDCPRARDRGPARFCERDRGDLVDLPGWRDCPIVRPMLRVR